MSQQEELLYKQIATELERGEVDSGLFAKALEKSRGDEKVALSVYISLRLAQLKEQLRTVKKSISIEKRRIRALKRKKLIECDVCGYEGAPTRNDRGNRFIFVLMVLGAAIVLQVSKYIAIVWLILILIYSITRSGYDLICPQCEKNFGAEPFRFW